MYLGDNFRKYTYYISLCSPFFTLYLRFLKSRTQSGEFPCTYLKWRDTPAVRDALEWGLVFVCFCFFFLVGFFKWVLWLTSHLNMLW